jgi:hypothetical protein
MKSRAEKLKAVFDRLIHGRSDIPDGVLAGFVKDVNDTSESELIAQLGGALSIATRTLDFIYSGAGAGKEWHKSPRRKAIAKVLADAGVKDPADYS